MIYCKIKNCLPNNVYVLESFNNQVELILEFYGVSSPKIGDSIALHENLFDIKSSKFTQPYSFEISDKKIVSEKEINEEIAILKTDKNIYVLKRIYG